jgi:hypothetical protein
VSWRDRDRIAENQTTGTPAIRTNDGHSSEDGASAAVTGTKVSASVAASWARSLNRLVVQAPGFAPDVVNASLILAEAIKKYAAQSVKRQTTMYSVFEKK